jgi:hypothetical protein
MSNLIAKISFPCPDELIETNRTRNRCRSLRRRPRRWASADERTVRDLWPDSPRVMTLNTELLHKNMSPEFSTADSLPFTTGRSAVYFQLSHKTEAFLEVIPSLYGGRSAPGPDGPRYCSITVDSLDGLSTWACIILYNSYKIEYNSDWCETILLISYWRSLPVKNMFAPKIIILFSSLIKYVFTLLIT